MGEVIAEKDDTSPGIIYAEIDLKKIDEARSMVPIKNHQQIYFDLKKLTYK